MWCWKGVEVCQLSVLGWVNPTGLVTSCLFLLLLVHQGHNAFIRKNLNHTVFSAEAGNLYNKHSYKYSGGCPSLLQQQRSRGACGVHVQLADFSCRVHLLDLLHSSGSICHILSFAGSSSILAATTTAVAPVLKARLQCTFMGCTAQAAAQPLSYPCSCHVL